MREAEEKRAEYVAQGERYTAEEAALRGSLRAELEHLELRMEDGLERNMLSPQQVRGSPIGSYGGNIRPPLA